MHHHGHHHSRHHSHHRPRTNVDIIVAPTISPFMYGFWNQPYYFYDYKFSLAHLILIVFLILIFGVALPLGIYYGFYKREKFTNENENEKL
jgi:hypothetical protein